jgi:hypothetical protein
MEGALSQFDFCFLGEFAKLRKAPISFFMSVGRHGATRLPLDGFAWNVTVIFENFLRNSKFYYSLTRVTGTLHDELCTFTIISRSFLVRMVYVAGKSYRGNQNTYFVFDNYFCFSSKIVPFMRQCGKNIVEQGRPQMTVWRMRIACWIPKDTNTHSYCFSTSTMVARTRLSVTLYVHCLSCGSRVRCL